MSHSRTALLTTLVGLGLIPLDATAQYPSSLAATFGFGAVPEEHRNGSYAGSMAVLWRLSPIADLGIEAGYQRFGSDPQRDIIGMCPFIPVGACEGQITAERRISGDLWFVGPTFRLALDRNAALRPFALWGLARYSSGEHTRVRYSDDRGVTVSLPGSGPFERTFHGVGASGGLGLQGPGLGRLQWAVLARAHGAIGGMSGEMASVTAYTLTAGVTLLLGKDLAAKRPWQITRGVSLRPSLAVPSVTAAPDCPWSPEIPPGGCGPTPTRSRPGPAAAPHHNRRMPAGPSRSPD
jgi:hypothetical protein